MSDTNTAPESGWNGWNVISSVWNPRSPTTPTNTRTGSMSDRADSVSSGVCVREEQASVHSFAASVESNVQINDQYVDLNAPYDGVMSVKSVDDGDDEKDPKQSQDPNEGDEQELNLLTAPDLTDSASPILEVPEQDAVMISQTLTLKSRNEELERERAQLQSDCLKMTMQTECLKQSNEHIIAAQQQEIERLQSENQDVSSSLHDKDEQLKQVQAELSRIRRERDNLQKKLDDIVNQRSNSSGDGPARMSSSAVLVENKGIVYGCIQCDQHLFDSTALVQRQIEIDDHSFGLIVDCLFNVNDLTMGPTVCKTFLGGMFKVRELYCDGCLGTFGWKICESFDEWNTFHQGKYCVNISNIKQVSHT